MHRVNIACRQQACPFGVHEVAHFTNITCLSLASSYRHVPTFQIAKFFTPSPLSNKPLPPHRSSEATWLVANSPLFSMPVHDLPWPSPQGHFSTTPLRYPQLYHFVAWCLFFLLNYFFFDLCAKFYEYLLLFCIIGNFVQGYQPNAQ